MAKVAVVLSEDFEDSEFRIPVERLKAAGHQVTIVGAKPGSVVKGKKGKESATIDASAQERKASEFDGLLIPGGYSPDHLRTDEAVVNQATQAFELQGNVRMKLGLGTKKFSGEVKVER